MSEDLKMENPVVQQSLMDSSTETREPSEQAALRVAEQEDSRKLSEIEARELELAKKAAELDARERQMALAEKQMEAEISDRKAEVEAEAARKTQEADSEIFQRKQAAMADISEKKSSALAALEKELSDFRSKRLKEIEEAEESERTRIRESIAKERENWDDERSKKSDQLAAEREEIEKLRGVLSAQMDEINRRNSEFQDRERDLEDMEERMRARAKKRSERLDQEAEELAAEYRATVDSEKAAMADENARLRASLKTQEDLLSAYKELEVRLGGQTPEKVLSDLNSKTEEIRTLREELASRPTDELRDRYETIARAMQSKDAVIEDLQRKVEAAAQATAAVADLKRQIQEAKEQSAASERLARIRETSAKLATAELEKLQADFDRLYGTPAGEDERREEIEMPYILRANARPAETAPDVNELEWLNGIYQACEDYGLHFNKRLLTAFHTSLKTAEWAPLTVLAGVSGTGKSELPRLYSHFGGLYFAPVSVQPNWDSQESMLGFFNSIDNRFDAQPVLNFLAQTQKDWEPEADGYPGLRDAMSLVLLDEMNLAHPELYFAEFLSKLELRRGTRQNLPQLDVKIGSGMKPYKLPLGRNVLWVGTMNQDETTKSLSDKVLDRSIVMNFPRPTELKRRQVLRPLDESNRGAILSKRTWGSWCQMKSTFTDEEIRPYKEFVEEMNASLGVAGRAIGHRVWQSVEYYMSNYPEVLAAADNAAKAKAMHIAFEDQLVQKVMPKLRGIDTRGKSKTECLDRIREQLITGADGEGFDLIEDFDQACELGYGQFIWSSANYLKEDDDNIETA
ncbi:hypothetical protein ACTNCR_05550 [Collinsella sp. HCP3S3_A7]|uniref:hypothetical protein n=1 Tax=unclassified Collinsella TaxID=2637548 RepID=UPI003F88D82E